MSQMKKTLLIFVLFVYVVVCGILIADLGTCSVAGGRYESIVEKLTSPNFALAIFSQWQGRLKD
jgi:hypothetical protein